MTAPRPARPATCEPARCAARHEPAGRGSVRHEFDRSEFEPQRTTPSRPAGPRISTATWPWNWCG